jgi:PhnB protein
MPRRARTDFQFWTLEQHFSATELAPRAGVGYQPGVEGLRAERRNPMAASEKYGLIPHLVVSGAARAVEFYKTALGAVEVARMAEENGPRLMHVELKIGDAALFLCDDFPEHCGGVSRAPRPGTPAAVTHHRDVPDCDAAIRRAAEAGATVTMPAADMFWGDRYGRITDPFGHEWSFAHPLRKAA